MIFLYVFDFDKTLISFDSFRRYVIYWIKYEPLAIFTLLIFRKLKLVDGEKFKRYIIQVTSKHPMFKSINQKFIEDLIPKVNFNIIREKTKNECNAKLVLVLSASPDLYVNEVANLLGILGKGSHFTDDQFIHLYGTGKVEYLRKYYPKEVFRYVYSISDSKTDLELLRLFETYDLI
jgi:phosphoserine phosphatase